uniref:Uncharacterized protein n=1 Tax=Anguilla anguilla TaxID=7936 RepID=A0A0E9VK26_ANGAN
MMQLLVEKGLETMSGKCYCNKMHNLPL